MFQRLLSWSDGLWVAKLTAIQKALGNEALNSERATGTGPLQDAQSSDLAQAPQTEQADAVGQAPEPRAVQQIAQIFEQPGVLTPRGKYVLSQACNTATRQATAFPS
jgi:hypothetical protein